MLNELILEAIDLEKISAAFVVKNLQTAEEYTFNKDIIVPSASLIKVCIMAAALKLIKGHKLSLNQRITLKSEDKVAYSILTLLETGNSYSIKDLLTLMIIQSDNTAANLFILFCFFVYFVTFVVKFVFKRRKPYENQRDPDGKINGSIKKAL